MLDVTKFKSENKSSWMTRKNFKDKYKHIYRNKKDLKVDYN